MARVPAETLRRGAGGRSRRLSIAAISLIVFVAFIVLLMLGDGGLASPEPAVSPGPPVASPPVVNPTPASSPSGLESAAPIGSPTPVVSASPLGSPTPVISASPVAGSPDPQGPDYLLMPRAELLSLPTSGSAWDTLEQVADDSWGKPNLCNQGRKHGTMALAGALVYARTGDPTYYAKVRDAIMSVVGSDVSRCRALSVGRQLGSYVLAADFIQLSGSDDIAFRRWLDPLRTQELGRHGRWTAITSTHADSANNWGAFAGASRIAASLYLGDTADVEAAAKVLRGFFGDRTAWTNFKGQDDENEILDPDLRVWSCDDAPDAFVPINHGCTKSGIDLDGAIVADVSRGGIGLIWPVGSRGIGYTLESLQGLILQTELLYRNGYSDAWEWSDSALKRAAGLVTRNGEAGGPSWNLSSVNYHVPWLLNFRYDLDLPTVAAGIGRTFGYTDWLYGSR